MQAMAIGRNQTVQPASVVVGTGVAVTASLVGGLEIRRDRLSRHDTEDTSDNGHILADVRAVMGPGTTPPWHNPSRSQEKSRRYESQLQCAAIKVVHGFSARNARNRYGNLLRLALSVCKRLGPSKAHTKPASRVRTLASAWEMQRGFAGMSKPLSTSLPCRGKAPGPCPHSVALPSGSWPRSARETRRSHFPPYCATGPTGPRRANWCHRSRRNSGHLFRRAT